MSCYEGRDHDEEQAHNQGKNCKQARIKTAEAISRQK